MKVSPSTAAVRRPSRQRTPENEVEEGGGREKGEGDEKEGVWGK